MSNNAGDKLKESPHKPGGAQEQQQAAAGDPNKKLVDLGLLEEDDEFEEFPEDEWVHGENAEDDEDVNVWEDNWDDDTVEDDFSNQLRSELERLQHVKGR